MVVQKAIAIPPASAGIVRSSGKRPAMRFIKSPNLARRGIVVSISLAPCPLGLARSTTMKRTDVCENARTGMMSL
jgi:hypothetical protein